MAQVMQLTPVSTKGTLSKVDYLSIFTTAALFGLSAVIATLLQDIPLFHLTAQGALLVTIVLGSAAKTVEKLMDGPSKPVVPVQPSVDQSNVA